MQEVPAVDLTGKPRDRRRAQHCAALHWHSVRAPGPLLAPSTIRTGIFTPLPVHGSGTCRPGRGCCHCLPVLPPTFQFTADEKLGLLFPMEKATTQVVFPSPATMPCPTPASDLRIANKSKCALCAPFCQTRCMSGQFVVHEVQVEGNRTLEISCAECRSGLYSTSSADEGEVLATQCTLCVSGTFSKQGSSACTACPVGYFQPEDGQLGCLSCDGLGDARLAKSEPACVNRMACTDVSEKHART